MRDWRIGPAFVVVLMSSCLGLYPTELDLSRFSNGLPPGWPSWDSVTVVAHRGYMCCNPENTLVALEAAVGSGARAVEIDVRMTQDNIPILIHDETFDRTTNTRGAVRNVSLRQLARVNACPARELPCEVPTLRSALTLVRGRARVVLDLKDADDVDAIARILADVEEVGVEHEVAIISPRLQTLVWVRALSQTTPIGLYVLPPDSGGNDPVVGERLIDDLIVLGGAELLIRISEIEHSRPSYEEARKRGIPVVAWTVRERDKLNHLVADPTVARVISDIPP